MQQYNNLSYISFKIFPLCNYTFLPATVKVSETLLEAVLRKPCQLFVAFLMTSVASQERWPFSADFATGNKQKSAGARSGEYGEMLQ